MYKFCKGEYVKPINNQEAKAWFTSAYVRYPFPYTVEEFLSKYFKIISQYKNSSNGNLYMIDIDEVHFVVPENFVEFAY